MIKINKKKAGFLTCIGLILLCFHASGQASIASSPPRLFYHLERGSSGVQRIRVSNRGNKPLDVGVSVGDWRYDSLGNNEMYDAGTLKTSCAKWIQVLPGAYFTVPPGGTQFLTVNLTVPADADTSVPVHTAMIYLSQLNPMGTSNVSNRVFIREMIRMGVKIYQNYSTENQRDVEITNFRDSTEMDTTKDKKGSPVRLLVLQFENTGKVWLDGRIQWELVSLATGEKIKMDPLPFYSLPGDNRTVLRDLPAGLQKGSKYTVSAIINYGNKDELKVAELDFEY